MNIVSEHPSKETSTAFTPQVGEIDSFKNDLKQLFRAALKLPNGRTGHMIKYDYSSIIPPGCLDSGADCWDRVTLLGQKSGYYIPVAEGQTIYRNAPYFSQLFAEPPTVVDLGPGGIQALEMKSGPTLRAVGGKKYIAIDINSVFANNAAHHISRKYGVPAEAVVQDFSKPYVVDATSPILMTMFGSTITQFPFARAQGDGESTLSELLLNLGNMVDYNAILIATIDANKHGPSAQDCYKGQHFDEFKRHFWRTAKTLVELSADQRNNYAMAGHDPSASMADAVVYAPRYEDGGIVHSFLTQKPMTFVIDGERFDIPSGTRMDTGVSKKWSADEVAHKIEESNCGWSVANVLTEGSSTVQALILAGKNVSPEQYARAIGHYDTNGQATTLTLGSSLANMTVRGVGALRSTIDKHRFGSPAIA